MFCVFPGLNLTENFRNKQDLQEKTLTNRVPVRTLVKFKGVFSYWRTVPDFQHYSLPYPQAGSNGGVRMGVCLPGPRLRVIALKNWLLCPTLVMCFLLPYLYLYSYLTARNSSLLHPLSRFKSNPVILSRHYSKSDYYFSLIVVPNVLQFNIFFSDDPSDCSWILTNHSLSKDIMSKYLGAKKINDTPVDKMKDNTYIVYFVFQIQIMFGMLADIHVLCKNYSVICWLL